MARKIIFELAGDHYEFFMEKIDRAKLYGKKEVRAVDAEGQPLQKGYLDEWGCVVIANTGTGYMGDEKQWIGRKELKATDQDGQELSYTKSSFDAPIILEDQISETAYIDHEVVSLYGLKGLNQDAFTNHLAAGDGLFSFPFMYRAGYLPTRAVLINNPGGLFMALVRPVALEMIGKPERVDVEEFGEEDELDFGMF